MVSVAGATERAAVDMSYRFLGTRTGSAPTVVRVGRSSACRNGAPVCDRRCRRADGGGMLDGNSIGEEQLRYL